MVKTVKFGMLKYDEYNPRLLNFIFLKAPEENSESFVIAASSKRQVGLLESKDFSEEAVLYVEGPHLMWLQKIPLFYYSLRLLRPTKPEAEDYDNEETSDGKFLCL